MKLFDEKERQRSLVNEIKSGRLGRDLGYDSSSGIRENEWTGESEVDIVFKTTGGKLIVIEVKRDNINFHGAVGGLGQALTYLKYCHSSYLAIPKTHQDTIKRVIEKVKYIGLIVFEGENYQIAHKAQSQRKIDDDYLIRKFDMEKKLYTKWVCPVRDRFIKEIFNTSIQQSGKSEKYGKYRLILFLHSLYNLMTKSNKGILDEFRDRLITGNWEAREKDIGSFITNFENKWFSFDKIYEQSKKICENKKNFYGKIHSDTSLKLSRDELVSIGIVEMKSDNNKGLYYRINPFFLENISRLINELEKS